jgi:glycerophosphoryl diester phosphodiesterase
MFQSTAKLTLITLFSVGLLGCSGQSNSTETSVSESPAPPISLDLLKYPLGSVLKCLPTENALVAAHRGTSRAWDIPENSLEALDRIINHGTLIAEIDVAGLKSGEQILFHDGVWDRKSTGKGPVASSTWDQAEKILLKSFAGTLSSERPPLLTDVLDSAKDKIFLEIDFKSSAKTDIVLKQIRERDMSDQVVLIAYTSQRAKELYNLAPEMIISAPGNDRGRDLNPNKTLLWMGRDISTDLDPTETLGYIGLLGKDDNKSTKASPSVFLVSDWPTDHSAIIGDLDNTKMKSCLDKT